MTREELEQTTHRALLIFIALQKVTNNSYTHFLGMFKHSEKQAFNNLIAASNLFCSKTSDNLPKESIEAADRLEEYLQDFIYTLIKDGEFTLDDDIILKKRLNEMLDAPEILEYDTYSIKHVLKLIDKSGK